MCVFPFLPGLLIPVVLPRRARAAGPVPGGKVSGQQVEEDGRRRHDGSQSRQGAHVAPPATPPLAAGRKVALIKGLRGGQREALPPPRSSRESRRVDI